MNKKIERKKQIQNNSLTTSLPPYIFCNRVTPTSFNPQIPLHTHTHTYSSTPQCLITQLDWRKNEGVGGARGSPYAISMYRKVQFLSLKKPYAIDPDVKKIVRPLFSVGFLPVHEMRPKIGQLCGKQATVQLHQMARKLILFKNFSV